MERITDWAALWRQLVEVRGARHAQRPAGDQDPWRERARGFHRRVAERWARPDSSRDLMLSQIDGDTTVLDIGAGTGILALTAALLGGRDILAFDNDPDCGPAMAEFIDLNAHLLDGRTPFRHFVGLLDDPQVRGPYQVLLANILLETIQELLPGMAEVAAPGGRLIASGILAERQDEALVSLVLGGFRPLRVVREGEWIAILAERT